MDNLLFQIDVSYLELAGFRHSETMAKHQEQQAIVTLPVTGKSLFAAGIQKLLDLIGSPGILGIVLVGNGSYSFCVMFIKRLVF
jgi:hypothetical protein